MIARDLLRAVSGLCEKLEAPTLARRSSRAVNRRNREPELDSQSAQARDDLASKEPARKLSKPRCARSNAGKPADRVAFRIDEGQIEDESTADLSNKKRTLRSIRSGQRRSP